MTPLLIGAAERSALQELRRRAALAPVAMPTLRQVLSTAQGKAAHVDQMTDQSVTLPFGFHVVLSVETGHPIGTCRHMSMSGPNQDRVPSPEAVWMVAAELGFVGQLAGCTTWVEDLAQGRAVNLIQPVAVAEGGTA